MTINQYYKNYLWLHKNPKCRLLHFLGQLVTIAFIAYTVSNFYWFLFPLIPFVVIPSHGLVTTYLNKTSQQLLKIPFTLKSLMLLCLKTYY